MGNPALIAHAKRKAVQHKARLVALVADADRDACVDWPGAVTRKGYGKTTIDNKPMLSHRAVFALVNGIELTPDQCVLHSCDRPACINPHHLRIGTPADNAQDKVDRDRCYRPMGELAPKAKLRVDDVAAIRNSTLTGAELARSYGVTPSVISVIRSRKTWKNVP